MSLGLISVLTVESLEVMSTYVTEPIDYLRFVEFSETEVEFT